MDAGKGAHKICRHRLERQGDGRLGSADQHVVPSGAALRCDDGARQGAETTLCAVSRDRVSHLARAGEADARGGRGAIGRFAPPRLKQETGGAVATRLGGAQKIGAMSKRINRK